MTSSLEAAHKRTRALWVLLGGGFVAWAAKFIDGSAFPGIDGKRYFCLFDDAMISMRYAWNLAHGNGLVWNAGERVEGYTNPLMTLLMAIPQLFLEERLAVLAVQVMGVVTMLATALVVARATRLAYPRQSTAGHGGLAPFLAASLVLGYYPLAYWSLMGMETGLLALFAVSLLGISLRRLGSESYSDKRDGLTLGGLAALVALTRPDGVLYAVTALAVVATAPSRPGLRPRVALVAVGMLGIALALHTAFRWSYYGELVPNTAVLKLQGVPASLRWPGGLAFVGTFLRETLPFWMVAVGALVRRRDRASVLPLVMAAPIVVYQAHVGGDPWAYWRLLAPTIALLAVPVAVELTLIAERATTVAKTLSHRLLKPFVASVLALAFLLYANGAFRNEWTLRERPFTTFENSLNVNLALALDRVASSDASVGVIWGGALPYFVKGRRAIDFLGKSDKRIARLAPDTSLMQGSRGIFAGLRTVPGHNKYDLRYSILELKPTYIQAYKWGTQDLTTEARAWYVAAFVDDFPLLVRQGAPEIDWKKVTRVEPLP